MAFLRHISFRLLAVFAVVFAVFATASAAPSRSVVTSAELVERAEQEARACGSETGDRLVVCGGEMLAELLDPALLVMRNDTCSRLLEELFETQTCDVASGDCGKLRGMPALPSLPRMPVGSSAAATFKVLHVVDREDGRLAFSIPRSEATPASRSIRPPTPPPRASLA